MKLLYLDCGMGAAGDMLTASLLELIPDSDSFIEELNSLNLPGVHIAKEAAVKCGITGTHVSVRVHGCEEHEHAHEHEHEHHHSSLGDIEKLIDSLEVPEQVKEDAKAVYKIIAEAESRVHGKPVYDIHFHEVGTLDAVADITACCWLIHKISPDKIAASAINTGSGFVKCAHGILPVPAPAAALILKDIPIYSDGTQAELCTPTGAALLRHFVSEFGPMPILKIENIGYGMGRRDFAKANCVRSILGRTQDADEHTDTICELSCNTEDMTGEELGFASAQIMAAGAADVSFIHTASKKSRPGIIIKILCRPELKDNIIAAVFKHTSTLGIRETMCRRSILKRTIQTIETQYGPVRCKISEGFGVKKYKYEYEDLRSIAEKTGLSLSSIKQNLPCPID